LSAQSFRSLQQARQNSLKLATQSAQAPSSADCLAALGFPCYSPQDIRKAYGVDQLLQDGFTGVGQTIVIIVSFGSPTVEEDLKTFDAAFGLPDPPSFRVIAPLGTVPFDPDDPAQLGWAGETSLDVQWAHALAPDANIVVLTSPVDETQGVQGLPEFLKLEKYALDNHLGNIVTQSWGTAEDTLFNAAGFAVLRDFEQFYERAARQKVTILAASGDSGTQNVDVNGNPFSFQTVYFPASSPFVTAVGGTSLFLDADGNYASETVWNNGGASGGGASHYFTEPLYQYALPFSTQRKLRNRRGIPDLALNADPNTPVLFYKGFFTDPANNGFYFGGGTSAAAPQWAGIVADANQLAGRPLGFLNPKLYTIGALLREPKFFHDIEIGNNAFNGLPGFNATDGWDLTTGWGTPNLSELLWKLCDR
jgi:subtilase family serine protease